MATPGGLHLQRPQTPDPWMLADGQTIRRPGGLQTYFPSIHTIVTKSKVRQGISIQRLDMANKTFLVMAVGKPVAVPPGHARKLYDLLAQQTEAHLLQKWQAEGFVLEAAGEPPRMSLKALRQVSLLK